MDVCARSMRLRVLNVDLGIELQLDMVGGFLGFGITGEGQSGGFQIDLRLWDIRSRDRKGDVVALCIGG